MKKKIRELKENKWFILLVIVLVIFFYFQEQKEIKELQTNISVMTKNFSKDKFYVYYLDVGQADSTLIVDKGEFYLIDAGNNADGPLLVEFFKELGITKFKYVFGTHAHEDHIGGMDDIINNFEIENFYMPNVVSLTKTYEDVLDALTTNKVIYDTPKIGDVLNIKTGMFKVLSVTKDDSDLNDTSIVLKLVKDDYSFLFMGDATKKIESKLNDKDIKNTTILKVGHHGSSTSSSSSFIKKVNPEYAIISVGRDNSYNHPTDVVLKRLEEVQATVFRTDLLNTIVVSIDNDELKIERLKLSLDGG